MRMAVVNGSGEVTAIVVATPDDIPPAGHQLVAVPGRWVRVGWTYADPGGFSPPVADQQADEAEEAADETEGLGFE